MLSSIVLAATLTLSPESAEQFANLALACVHKEYPNKVAHVLQSDADAKPPRELTPAFYGCYDWHSSVHGHWLLARLSRLSPEAPFAEKARAALKQSITPETIAAEVAYLHGAGRASFERPYGLAWLLQLTAELRESNDPLYATIQPLENAAVERLRAWLPKLSHPVRSGEHSQTAFALGLIIDSHAGGAEFLEMVKARARAYYAADRSCPLAYEPSGEDFLSPCLAEADVMRRVLPPNAYAEWLARFLPEMTLKPAVVTDPSDPKLAHLDGLNLSRAWMLDGIAWGLPENDARVKTWRAASEAHAEAGLASVTGEHYEGGHWLGSFATYLVTRRGIPDEVVPVYREPMHRLVSQNRYARIMDVLIPPGETSRYHEHAARIAGVILSDARYWAQKPGEDRGPLNVPLAPGSPIENWTAQLPYTHRVGNVDVVPLHYIVAEPITPSNIEADALPDTATRKLIKEGAVARYYRIIVEPGQSTEAHSHAQPGITVNVTDGTWQWRDPNHQHVLRNDGKTRVEIVEVDLR